MNSTLLTILLWFCALGCGLLAGLYYAFSAFIMRALERAGVTQGVAAMNSINVVILRSSFMPLFFGTTIASAVLVVAGVLDPDAPASRWMIAGGAIYVIGMFVVTMICNVPLNNALASAGSANESAATWARYLKTWTRWNHVRTLASLVASALFIAALV